MAYTTSRLTDAKIKAAKPRDKLYSLADGGNLLLFIRPSGVKVWRYNYRIHGKSKTLTIGRYPTISLAEARERCMKARTELMEGHDPALLKRSNKSNLIEDSFQSVAESWISDNSPNWSESHTKRTVNYFKRDVFPFIGAMPLKEIQAKHIIMVVKSVAARGANEAAKRLKSVIGQVFEYGLMFQLCERNPTKDISTRNLGLPKNVKVGFSAITDPKMFGGLMRDIEGYGGGVIVRHALKLAPYLAMRPSELTGGNWSEIDFEEKLWILPAKRRKLHTHIKKANRPEDALIIPLAPQVIKILKNLKLYTGQGVLMFPGQRGGDRSLSENALRVALRSMGYSNNDHTGHGFRHSFSTMLNNLGYESRLIESALGHKPQNEIEAAYNRANLLERRKVLMIEWADYIDGLKQA